MSFSAKLNCDAAGVEVDPTLYRSMIGSLLYLTAGRPDIAFSVGVCARFQAAPKESHLTAVKWIIRYINGTSDYGIWYSRDSNECLAGYYDADWAGCIDDRKSTSGGCFYLGNNLVSWMSKKQNSVSLSTTEAEYIAAASCCAQLWWMKKLLHDYGITQDTLCVCVLWQYECHKFIQKFSSTLKIKAYRDPVPLHSGFGGGKNCIFGIHQHWQPERRHFY